MVAFKTLALAALLPLQALARASEAPEAPMPGYTVVDMEWEVEVFPGQFENFTGTVQDAHRQALAVNPQWKPPVVNSTASVRHSKRYAWWTSMVCGGGPHGWKACDREHLNRSVAHLRGMKGNPSHGPGPAVCGRVSCDTGAAIWWCNDNKRRYTLNSWKDIADGADRINWMCGKTYGDGLSWIAGQVFARHQWNVIVRKDSC